VSNEKFKSLMENNENTIRKHFRIYFYMNFCLFLFVNASVLRQKFGIDPTYISLIVTWASDIYIITIIFSSRKLRMPGILAYWIIYCLTVFFPLGILFNEFSTKHITDTLRVVFFTMKVVVFCNIFQLQCIQKDFSKYMKYSGWFIIIITFISLPLIYVYVVNNPGLYYTASPNLTIPLAYFYLMQPNLIMIILSLCLVIFTTKRALLIGSVVLLLSKPLLLSGSKAAKSFFYSVSTFVLVVFGAYFLYYQFDIQIFTKYLSIIEKLNDQGNFIKLLSIVDPARYGEIIGILKEMNTIDWLTGKGVGFSYQVQLSPSSPYTIKGDGHFTPLTLLSKFGFLGTFIFLGIFITAICAHSKHKIVELFCKCILLSLLVQSLFSYLLFNNFIIPLCLGWLLAQRKEDRSPRCPQF
jgi:hypothetical protein